MTKEIITAPKLADGEIVTDIRRDILKLVVVERHRGALEAMARPFKFFVGGPLGSGKQVVSWIHLDDMARALLFCAMNERLRGPVNLTAPEPVDDKTLSRILGEVLHRPSALPAPAFALRALLGDGAEPILTGQRALPKKLLEAGFEFHYDDAKVAVRSALAD